MDFSKKVLNRFCKDFKLPITIFTEPIFSYQKELYSDYYDLPKKFTLLENEISKCGSQEKFLDNIFKIRDDIITQTKALPEYQEYLDMDMNKFAVQSSVSNKDIFKESNVGKIFLSIDLVKANYQAMRYVNPKLVFDTSSYEDYISKFTDSEYFKESKYLREVIFGNMNPRRQVTIEKYMVKRIFNFLLLYQDFMKDKKIVSFSNDELVFEITSDEEKILLQDDFLYECCRIINKRNFGIDIRIEIFKLLQVGDKPYYVKEFILGDKEYEFKCVPKEYLPQVFKKYNNIELDDKDLYFVHNGELCKFVNPLFKGGTDEV